MYEPGDVHPSGVKNAKIAIIREVFAGGTAKKMGYGVAIAIEECDATANQSLKVSFGDC